MKQKCASSASLKALDGKLLSDRASVAAGWQEHFSTLLNRPTQSPPDALVSEARASTPDSFPPTFTEVYKAVIGNMNCFLCNDCRNLMLANTKLKLPRYYKTGTTIAGVIFKVCIMFDLLF